MAEATYKCVWRGEAYKKGGGWLSSAYKKRCDMISFFLHRLVAHTPRPALSGGGPEAARARRTHTHRYFVIEKVKVEGGPDKFYATRLLKYYADKEAYTNDPNSFKGCIQCSIKTPVHVQVGVSYPTA